MTLETLSNARGVSGNEAAVRDLILDAVREQIDEHTVDALGNLICLKRARPEGAGGEKPLRVMVAAHMDEIGLIVTGINNDGSLSFDKVGGIDDRVLLSKQVLVGDKAVPGVIGYAPIHLIPASERNKAPDMTKAVIDIGAANKGAAEGLVNVGDYVTFHATYQQLDSERLRTARGKAFDDRAGCAVLVELLQGEHPVDLYAAFTAQEEVGLRGAQVAAYRVNPDVAIALEGTICDDLPKEEDDDSSPVTQLGQGPAITFMDRSFIADRRLVDLLIHTAEENDIPYQFKQAVSGGTDAGAMHLAREGVPSVALAVPSRYIHAPVSLLSLNDFDHTVQLVRAALSALQGGLPS